MQSATSFFNRALFRKNLQRFWPLWLGYVLIWLLLLPLPLLNELADYHGVPTVADASYYLLQIGAYGGLVMGAVFGIFFAMAMFAYLTNPRATQGFHSMPVRRETLYATNYLTGLVCMVSALVLAFASRASPPPASARWTLPRSVPRCSPPCSRCCSSTPSACSA